MYIYNVGIILCVYYPGTIMYIVPKLMLENMYIHAHCTCAVSSVYMIVHVPIPC